MSFCFPEHNRNRQETVHLGTLSSLSFQTLICSKEARSWLLLRANASLSAPASAAADLPFLLPEQTSTAVFYPLPLFYITKQWLSLTPLRKKHHFRISKIKRFLQYFCFLLWAQTSLISLFASIKEFDHIFHSVKIKRTSVPNTLVMIAKDKLAANHPLQCHRPVHCPSGIRNRDLL